ncbi:MAG: hypothetical protein LBT14_06300 [Treponema sp.]|jgi:hypothetical protein|nr:hypothetical protein [Treponema sp.]
MKHGVIPGFIMMGFILTGCISLVEKAGQVLDGSAFAEKTVAVYRAERTGYTGRQAGKKDRYIEVRQVRHKDGSEQILLSTSAFPTLRLRGSAPGHDGSFYFLSLDFLASHYAGWNEFTLDLSGTGTFTQVGNIGTLKFTGPLEPVQISRGKIRHNNSRLTGTQALTELRNRYERIAVFTEWMHTLPGIPDFKDQKDFEAYWKPLLLPELVAPKKRPANFTHEPVTWVRAEDIAWNTRYTELFFPEDLWVLRNSGSLLRDWEEAVSWIYFEYTWDHIIETLKETRLIKN